MIKNLIKMMSQHIIFPIVYRLNCFKPIDSNVVVLADSHKKKCPPQMEQLRTRLIKENYDVRDFFFDIDEIGYKKGFLMMLQFMKLYAVSGHVIICDNFLPVASCRKRKKTDVIQLWHGPGMFKRFGYDTTDDIPKFYKGNVYNNYNLVTVSSEACVPTYKRAMRINWENSKNVVMPLGISHTDRLYDKDYINACKDRLYYEYPDARKKKIVLWAPTFRGKAANGTLVGEEIVDRLVKNDTICNDFYIIKSVHPHIKKNIGSKSDFNMKTDELIACADILITDYSSVFFEYLIMDKPIIFFAPDYNDYSERRGFYLDYEALPGEIITGDAKKTDEKLEKELAEAIHNSVEKDDDYMREKRREYRKMYMSSCDGNATDRIINYIKSF